MEYVRLKEDGIIVETPPDEKLNYLVHECLKPLIPREKIKEEIPRGRILRVLEELSLGFEAKTEERAVWLRKESVLELTDLENKILSMEEYLAGSG